MITPLAKRLGLEENELRHALVLALVLAAITSSYTLVKTARDSLYLSQLRAQSLPYVYLAVGAMTLALSQVFARLTRRLSAPRSLGVTAALSAASLLLFSPTFRHPSGWIPVAFYLWVNLYGLILVAQFWVFVTSSSDPSLAKRTFGLIGAGGILGGLVGGILASVLARVAGFGSITILAALLLAAVVPIVILGVRHGVTPVAAETPPEKATRPWSHSYLRWLAIGAMCSVMITGLLDYQLKVEVQRLYPGKHELAHFFGLFYIGVNLGALTVQLLVTSWALQSLGASTSALVLPAGIGIGAAFTVAAPGMTTALGTRLWDQMVRLSINKSATELFYFPLDPALRRHAKAVIDAGLERMGDGLAAILILAITFTVGASTGTLAWVVLGIVAVWLVVWYRLRGQYAIELGRNLRRLKLDPDQTATTLRERALIKEMLRLVESPYERPALYAMDLLEESALRLLEKRLPRLIRHRSPRVRARALALISTRQTEEAREQIRALLADEDPEVRLQALRAHCALGESCFTPLFEEYLDAEQPHLRATAMRLLVEYASPEEEPRMMRVLEERLRDGSSAERAEVAGVLGHAKRPERLAGLLEPLLEDHDLETRRAAMRSVGLVRGREATPLLIQALADRDMAVAACEGLVAMGEGVTGTLGDHLVDPTGSIEVRREIPHVLREFATRESVAALLRCRDPNDLKLRYRILKALNRVRSADPALEFPAMRVREELEYEAQRYLRTLVYARSCPDAEPRGAEHFLHIVLRERMEQALERLFRWLALIYPAADVHAAYRGIKSDQAERTGNAREFLDTILSVEDRALIAPLIDHTHEEDRVALAEKRHNLHPMPFTQVLEELLEGDDPWLHVCALYVIGRLQARGLEGEVRRNLAADDPRVRETAGWAQHALANGVTP